ncbi:hypothetical protein P9112_011646 [Eukaryota sp. TZLM1-RC]
MTVLKSKRRAVSAPRTKTSTLTSKRPSSTTRRRPSTVKSSSNLSSRKRSISRPKSRVAVPKSAWGSRTTKNDQESTFASPFHKAAHFIKSSDVLIILAGAGFSADSGLPTYQEIAKVPAYKRLNLSYDNLCTPRLLTRDPDLFYGFWGSCYNSYKDANPHSGYDILRNWTKNKQHFVVTSNVDELFLKAGFEHHTLCQIHGSCFEFQCTLPCNQSTFRLSKDYRFHIDSTTQRIVRPSTTASLLINGKSRHISRHSTPSNSLDTASFDTSAPGPPSLPNSRSVLKSAGQHNFRHCSRIPHLFFPSFSVTNTHNRHITPVSSHHVSMSVTRSSSPPKSHLPQCPVCFTTARPNVCMFNDDHWIEKSYADEERLYHWLNVFDKDASLCVVELGCGTRVPTLKEMGYEVFKKYVNARYIRINYDSHLARVRGPPAKTVGLSGTCLEVLNQINMQLEYFYF